MWEQKGRGYRRERGGKGFGLTPPKLKVLGMCLDLNFRIGITEINQIQ